MSAKKSKDKRGKRAFLGTAKKTGSAKRKSAVSRDGARTKTKKAKKRVSGGSFWSFGRLIVIALSFAAAVWAHIYFCACINSSDPYSPDIAAGLSAALPFFPLWGAVLVAVFAPLLCFRGRGRAIWAIGAVSLFSLATLAELAYYRAFNACASLRVLVLAKNTTKMGIETVARLSVCDLALLPGLVIVILAAILLRKSLGTRVKHTFGARMFRSFATIWVAALILAFLPVTNAFGIFGDAYKKAYSPARSDDTCVAFTGVGYYAEDIWHIVFGDEKMSEDDSALLARFYDWNDEKLPDNKYTSLCEGKNLLIIQAESLESFIIGQKLGGSEITPNLNSLVNSYGTLYLPAIHQQVKAGNSIDCDFLLATSMLPLSNGRVFPLYGSDDFITFAKLLGNMGYTTSYYNDCRESLWEYKDVVRETLGYDRLFSDEYEDLEDEDGSVNGYVSDAEILSRTADIMISDPLYKSGESFMSHIVLSSTHIPFDTGNIVSKLPDDSNLAGTTLYDYLCLMNFVDSAIGDFMSRLEGAGILDNTVVVVIGDHGGIHRYYPRECDRIAGLDGYGWVGAGDYPCVPLIIYGTDCDRETIETVGGQVDIMPTLASLFGIPRTSYARSALGRNLLNTNRSFTVTTDNRIIADDSFMPDKETEDMLLMMSRLSELVVKNDCFAKMNKNE